MYFLTWIIVGLITGRMTGKLLAERGYGPFVDSVMGIAGGMVGGFIMYFSNSPAPTPLVHTGVAAFSGAVALTYFTTIIIGRGRLT